jgi:hypothetical protein
MIPLFCPQGYFAAIALNELRTTQQQIEALHRAWLAQATLLKRHAFPGRWVMVVLAAMILTWVFSRFQLSWG